MKTENRTFFQTLGKTQLENLVKEVKETIAVDAPALHHKNIFCAADLWNLERMLWIHHPCSFSGGALRKLGRFAFHHRSGAVSWLVRVGQLPPGMR